MVATSACYWFHHNRLYPQYCIGSNKIHPGYLYRGSGFLIYSLVSWKDFFYEILKKFPCSPQGSRMATCRITARWSATTSEMWSSRVTMFQPTSQCMETAPLQIFLIGCWSQTTTTQSTWYLIIFNWCCLFKGCCSYSQYSVCWIWNFFLWNVIWNEMTLKIQQQIYRSELQQIDPTPTNWQTSEN